MKLSEMGVVFVGVEGFCTTATRAMRGLRLPRIEHRVRRGFKRAFLQS
jgi:hypothetical protein